MTSRSASATDLTQVVVRCPDCHELADVGVHIAGRLVVDEGHIRKLAAKMKSTPVDHICRQIRLADPEAPEPEPTLDYGQLAAGEGVVRSDPDSGYTSR